MNESFKVTNLQLCTIVCYYFHLVDFTRGTVRGTSERSACACCFRLLARLRLATCEEGLDPTWVAYGTVP